MDYSNKEDIEKTYEFLNHEFITEIRLIDPKKQKPPKSIFVTNKKDFVEKCILYAGDYNVYVGIHERENHGTTKKDVKSIKTIIVDADPIRLPGIPSTEEELQEAIKVVEKIEKWLKEKGIESYKAMSGNGCHLWIPIPTSKIIDEKRDEDEESLKRLYRFLQSKFNTEKVKIDNIGDLPRIIKVIGTISIKGENTPERPWRISKWIDEPKRVENKNIFELFKEVKEWSEKNEKNVKKSTVINKDIEEVEAKLNIILKYDKNVKKLLNGEKEFPSRSEEEMAIVNKLVAYGLNFEEVDKIMQAYGPGKWGEKGNQAYKEITFRKAVENKPLTHIKKPEIAEWLKLKVDSIIIFQGGEESVIKIEIDGDSIKLSPQDLVNANKFKTLYFINYGEMLPPIPTKLWSEILTLWNKTKGRVVEITKNEKEELIKEKVITEIGTFLKVKEKEEAIDYGRAIEEDGEILIASKTIDDIIKKLKLNISLQRLSFLLSDYLIGKTKLKKINGKPIRFWRFKPSEISLEEEIRGSILNDY